jgi:hypothetical protein
MSETLYSDIRAALTAQLKTMPGLPDVAWENMPYTPVVGTPYLTPVILWAEGSQAELGVTGSNWERGIYQIACNYPPNQGSGALNAMLGKIRERFKRGTRLTYNGLTVTIRKVYPGPNGIISIAFYCFAAN